MGVVNLMSLDLLIFLIFPFSIYRSSSRFRGKVPGIKYRIEGRTPSGIQGLNISTHLGSGN